MGERIEQSAFWDDRADAWTREADDLEAFAGQFSDPAIELLDPRPGEHVADVGCGPGITTVALARRVAPGGTATGVDVAPRMVEAANARARASGLDNVSFVLGDPGAGPIGSFDAVFSRFGVMFFDDPPVAFANLASSLRPGGRFVAVAWGELGSNPWMSLPTMFAAGPLQAEINPPGPDEPGPFSLADPAKTSALLGSSGFEDVTVTRREGAWTADAATIEGALARVMAVGPLGAAWAGADESARAVAMAAVRDGLEEHRHGDGWRVPAVALVISASVAP
ncbi:MAG TPA: class I SAM-dependent methyltransferase [Acidimicrobiales bacterium]|nr:class I SAM-dependent methyltransferase [Acidimicrobiales bacterium]